MRSAMDLQAAASWGAEAILSGGLPVFDEIKTGTLGLNAFAATFSQLQYGMLQDHLTSVLVGCARGVHLDRASL